MNEWQDIASAPKDGTPILVWSCSVRDELSGEALPLIGHWCDIEGWTVGEWDPEFDCYRKTNLVSITHWQPLPAPPGAHK